MKLQAPAERKEHVRALLELIGHESGVGYVTVYLVRDLVEAAPKGERPQVRETLRRLYEEYGEPSLLRGVEQLGGELSDEERKAIED